MLDYGQFTGGYSMKTNQLFLRCFAEKKDGQWSAVCIDLCLAAQADTLKEVQRKMDEMVQSYVEDALFGVDQAHAFELLNRKPPLSLRFKYHFIKAQVFLHETKKMFVFQEMLPLKLA